MFMGSWGKKASIFGAFLETESLVVDKHRAVDLVV